MSISCSSARPRKEGNDIMSPVLRSIGRSGTNHPVCFRMLTGHFLGIWIAGLLSGEFSLQIIGEPGWDRTNDHLIKKKRVIKRHKMP